MSRREPLGERLCFAYLPRETVRRLWETLTLMCLSHWTRYEHNSTLGIRCIKKTE